MAKKIGGLWISFLGLDSTRVENRMTGRSASCSIHLPSLAVPPSTSLMAILSLRPGVVSHLALVTTGRNNGELQRKVVVGPSLPLQPALQTTQLLSLLPTRYAAFLKEPTSAASSVPPATWEKLLDALLRTRAIEQVAIDRFRALVSARQSQRTKLTSSIPQLERDAVALALDIAGGSATRQRVLSATPDPGDAPFITALADAPVVVLEDRLIEHDLRSFPGGTELAMYAIGAVRVDSGRSTLTILNANRARIENTLGVDLVYYNHERQAFVMVQYKLMRRSRNSQEHFYRPSSDPNYRPEIERMRSTWKRLKTIRDPNNEMSYRLAEAPFFLKLCNASQRLHASPKMLPGMYFPLRHWLAMLRTPNICGPRGGIRVGWDSAPRYLTNSQFSTLVRDAWIGTNAIQTRELSLVVQAAIEGHHSVLLAIEHPHRAPPQFSRDYRGRFAPSGSPEET